ncbi:LysR family transcriptional regulator [Enterococcus sp. ALS3]|uniref:LysR family transcriptional regulator n=1 Tax=Enterococcus alishanensis TaxID=1303817 RepID=A0ABS6TH53_9ENTE|nr:LysR family transcriptional regulator [Enterococcus alishanensis]MBV7392226.1 LysR family transcriptional regulator [Enterococcus alishanensis]
MYNHLLDTFITVVDMGSFAKASESLFISAPAVMKQMNLLEEQLDLQLIERSHQGITLTEVGQSIYEDSKKIIAFSEEAMTRADNLMKDHPWKIKIGSSLLNPSQQISSLLAAIRKKNNRFSFEIVPFDDNRDTIISVLHQLGTTYDIIAGSYTADITAKLAGYHELYPVTFTIAVPLNHPLSQKDNLEIEDLFGETLVSGKSSPNRPVGILQADLAEKYPEIKQEITSEFYDMNVFNKYDQSNKLLLSLPQWQYVQPNFVTLPVNWPYQNIFGLLYPLKPKREVTKFLEYVSLVQKENPTE